MLLTPRSVFIHIPKTGGMWVIDAITATGTPVHFGYQHMPPEEILPVVPDRFSFTFVRHPVDWWRSWWSHAARMGAWPSTTEPFERICYRQPEDTYEAFMTKVLNDCPGEYSRIVQWYTAGVQHIGRTERLEADLWEFLDEAGEPPLPDGLSPVNVGAYDERAASTGPIDREIVRTEYQMISMFYGGQ